MGRSGIAQVAGRLASFPFLSWSCCCIVFPPHFHSSRVCSPVSLNRSSHFLQLEMQLHCESQPLRIPVMMSSCNYWPWAAQPCQHASGPTPSCPWSTSSHCGLSLLEGQPSLTRKWILHYGRQVHMLLGLLWRSLTIWKTPCGKKLRIVALWCPQQLH